MNQIDFFFPLNHQHTKQDSISVETIHRLLLVLSFTSAHSVLGIRSVGSLYLKANEMS